MKLLEYLLEILRGQMVGDWSTSAIYGLGTVAAAGLFAFVVLELEERR